MWDWGLYTQTWLLQELGVWVCDRVEAAGPKLQDYLGIEVSRVGNPSPRHKDPELLTFLTEHEGFFAG